MKLFKETHNEDADLAVIQYGGGTICTVEAVEITEEEIDGMFGDRGVGWSNEYERLTLIRGAKAILSKLKGND